LIRVSAWLQTIPKLLFGGADIRYIQQLLGHEKLETTAIYTEVSIAQLKAIHARSHPAEKRKRIDPETSGMEKSPLD
jgi:integrase/recombinase XerD